VRVESLFGPSPGTTVGEGSYNMLIRLTHNREQLKMCKYRYHVTGMTYVYICSHADKIESLQVNITTKIV